MAAYNSRHISNMVWYAIWYGTHSTKGRTSASVAVTIGMHPAARESYTRRLEAVSPLGQKQNLQTDKRNETTRHDT